MATLRLEPMIDLGMIDRLDRYAYRYRLSAAQRSFWRLLSETPDLPQFSRSGLVAGWMVANGHVARKAEADEMWDGIRGAYEALRSSLGFASFAEVILLAIGRMLDASPPPLVRAGGWDRALHRAAPRLAQGRSARHQPRGRADVHEAVGYCEDCMTEPHEHLNLRGWPFQAVPSEQTAKVWVGHPEALRRLRGLLRTVQRIDASRIVLLWAAYGAGKTHALLHLQASAAADEGVQTLYVVTPKGIKSSSTSTERSSRRLSRRTCLPSWAWRSTDEKGGRPRATFSVRSCESCPSPSHSIALRSRG